MTTNILRYLQLWLQFVLNAKRKPKEYSIKPLISLSSWIKTHCLLSSNNAKYTLNKLIWVFWGIYFGDLLRSWQTWREQLSRWITLQTTHMAQLTVARSNAQNPVKKSCTKIPSNTSKFYVDFTLIFWKTEKIATCLLSFDVWRRIRQILAR